MNDIKKILVVDDDESMLEFCLKILCLDGFAVVAASSGKQAVDLLKTTGFDLVLTDHVTVGAEATPIIKAVKSLQPDAPVIVMSGIPRLEDAAASYLAGADEYLAKPFSLAQLREAMTRCLQPAL